MPKRVKMFTSKWHRKQRHFFIHPFRSLQCIWFVGRKYFVENKLTRAYLKWGRGGEFSTIPSFGAPLHFDWTKLAHAQLGYGAYNMGVGTGGGGHRGHVPPLIILPSEIFNTQCALLSRKLAHKMFIFNKIFRFASLPNQELVTRKSTNSNVQIISPHSSKKFLC